MGEYKKRSKPTVVATSEFGKLPPQAINYLYLCIAVQS